MRHSAQTSFRWTLAAACLTAALLGGCPWPWGTQATTPSPLGGRILDMQGRPVGGVLVRASFTNAIPFTNGIPFSTQGISETTSEVRTGTDGRFSFSSPPVGEVNVEAIQSDERKAVRQSVAVRSGVMLDLGDMRLAPVGGIAGRITTPNLAGINLLGTDVFTPGLGYLVKTDEQGNFRLSNVPAGRFRLVATNQGLGRGELADVEVRPGEVTSLDAIPLSLTPPVVGELRPAMGGPGSQLEIIGQNFGKSAGLGSTVEVYLSGVRLSDVTVENDQRIRARVPNGAQSGRVVVKVGLISGVSPADFKVIADLRLSPAGPLILPLNGSFRFTALASDSAGEAISAPFVTWAATPDAVLAPDPATPGQYQGHAIGSGLATLFNGTISSEARVFVSPTVGSPFSHGTGAPGSRVSVAVGSAGAIALWSGYDETNGTYRIQGQRLSGTSWAASDLTFAASFPADPMPVLAWGSGKFWLAYADGSAGSRQIKLQRLDASGAPSGGPLTLADTRPGVLSLAVAPGVNDALVAWQESPSSIQCRLYSSGLGAPTTLVASNASRPSAAWDGSAYAVCWEQAIGADTDVMARVVNDSGVAALSAFGVAEGPNSQRQPWLTGGLGHMMAVWSETRGGQREIGARRVVGGTALGTSPTYLGALHPGHGEEAWPAIASLDANRYLLAWIDGRPDAPGAFAQVLDKDLSAPGTPFAVSLGGGLSGPAIAGSGPDAFLAWLGGNVSSGPSIGGQRLAP
ncbi:MAG TPA: hypothetical protein V6D00_04155 [Pantanalinema sp.]